MARTLLAFTLLLIIGCHGAFAQTTCATDGSSASVSVTSDTYNNIPVWRIKSSGCPNWNWSKQSAPGSAQVINTEAIIPKNPIMCKKTLKIDRQNLAVKGTVGLLLNGVALFNDGDAQDKDAYINEGRTMDQCLGHVAINTYHTHTMPGGCCLTTESKNGRHSPAFGVLADGVPIYGPFGDNGNVPTDLDECRGHVDETYPFYHYHATANLTGPYTVGCLKGCVISNFAGNRNWQSYVGVDAADKQYDYSSLKLNWDATPVNASTINNCPYKYAPDAGAPPPFASPSNNGGGNGGAMPGGKTGAPGNGNSNNGGGSGNMPGGKTGGTPGNNNNNGGNGGALPGGKMPFGGPGGQGGPIGGGNNNNNNGGGLPGGKQGGPMNGGGPGQGGPNGGRKMMF